jgi:peptidoglycan/LPS O-acetylase OafA/YrhL
LDAVRGIAAIVVMLRHIMVNGPAFGFTAVDLFFILSGFVVAFAYLPRIEGGMSFWPFVRLRLIRIFPLYFVGLLIGVVSFLPVGPLFHGSSPSVPTIAGLNLLFIPYLDGVAIFPLNSPAWSLLDEMLINIFFGYLAVRHLRIGIFFCLGLLGIILIRIFDQGSGTLSPMDGGWSNDNAWIGVVRVIYGFPLGVMLCRFYMKAPAFCSRFPGWLVILVAAMALLIPDHIPGRIHSEYPYALAIIVYPAVVLLGAYSTLGPLASRFFGWLGGISTPSMRSTSPYLSWSASSLDGPPM